MIREKRKAYYGKRTIYERGIEMKKLFRIIAMVVLNLVTLPVQIGILLVVLASTFTKDEWEDIFDFCEEAEHFSKTWIKTGRFSE